MQTKAVRFLRDLIGDDEKADEIESLSVTEYAERKGLRLSNPTSAKQIHSKKRSKHMSTGNDLRTKADLIAENEGLLALCDEIWDVVVDLEENSSKSDLFEAVDEVASLLNEYDEGQFPIDDDEQAGQSEENEEAA